MSPPDLPEEGTPGYWLRRARSVFAIAATPQAPKDALPADLCFNAQQAAEKALKAACEHVGVRPPATHDVRVLLDLLSGHLDVPDSLYAAEQLTRYAVEERYLGALDAITEQHLTEAVTLAGEVVAWAEDVVGKQA